MAKGLRKGFHGSAKLLFSIILGKFRDKKTLLVDETKNTLNSYFYAINFEDVIDDVKEALADKAAVMKMNTLNWIEKFYQFY